jgi:hypothetical protein
VATVDATTGAVTLVGPGTTQITATKAADAAYLSATATYTITVSQPGSIPFVASIGTQDSQVVFPSWAGSFDFLRSTQSDCDTVQFNSCTNAQINPLAGATAITDTAATLTSDASYWLRSGSTVGSPTLVSLHKFPARTGSEMVTFHGKLCVVSGQKTDIAYTSDVWSSHDGIAWTLETADAGFAVRNRPQLVVFNDRLWMIGGNGAGPYVKDVWRNDVWSSADGVTWRQETAAAAFSGRFNHSAVAFKGKMWVIAGGVYPGGTGGNDVWSSVDGINWTLENGAAPFGYRGGQTVTEFNGQLWLIGGSAGQGLFANDVWTSSDGVNWTLVTANAEFPGRAAHAAGVVNGRLLIAAGATAANPYANDVWSSADGAHWTQSTGVVPFTGRVFPGYAVYNGRLFVEGGEYAAVTQVDPPNGPGLILHFADDVWSTPDGSAWTQMTPYAPLFAGVYNIQALGGKLWIIGGHDGARSRNEVWSTSDGAHWSQTATGSPFTARSHPGVVTFNNRFWVVGGVTDDGATDLTDVWSSADGSTWTNVTNTAAFGQRHGHSVVTLGNLMYVTGGLHGSTYMNDVWTSTDGASWTQVSVSAPFPARANASVVSYNGRLWILGGSDSTGPLTDAWSSADGATWQLASSSIPALPNMGASLTVHAGQLWLSGGYHFGYVNFVPSYIYSNAVWSSTDGASWAQIDAAAPYSGRSDTSLVDFNNQLWVIGGHDFYAPRNDAWFSSDGANWRVVYSGTLVTP